MNARLHRFLNGQLSHHEACQWRAQLAAQTQRTPEEEALLAMLPQSVSFDEEWADEEACEEFDRLLQAQETAMASTSCPHASTMCRAATTESPTHFVASPSPCSPPPKVVPPSRHSFRSAIRWTAAAAAMFLLVVSVWWANFSENALTPPKLARQYQVSPSQPTHPVRQAVPSLEARLAASHQHDASQPKGEVSTLSVASPSAGTKQTNHQRQTKQENLQPHISSTSSLSVKSASSSSINSLASPSAAEVSSALEEAYRLHRQEKAYAQLLREMEYQTCLSIQDSLLTATFSPI